MHACSQVLLLRTTAGKLEALVLPSPNQVASKTVLAKCKAIYPKQMLNKFKVRDCIFDH